MSNIDEENSHEIEDAAIASLARIEKYGGGCMGPSYPDEQEVDSVTNSVISYLARVHYLLDSTNEMSGRSERLNKLRDAIKEIMWQDNCEKF